MPCYRKFVNVDSLSTLTRVCVRIYPGPPTLSQPKRIPRSYPSLKNTPFSRILDEKNSPFSTEIADFEAQ